MPEIDHTAVFTYVQAWRAKDTEAAQVLLSKCWTEESEIVGPGFCYKGLSAVIGKVERFRAQQPGYKTIATSSFDSHGRWTQKAREPMKAGTSSKKTATAGFEGSSTSGARCPAPMTSIELSHESTGRRAGDAA